MNTNYYVIIILSAFLTSSTLYSEDSKTSPIDRATKILKYGSTHSLSEPNKIDAVHALGILGGEEAVTLLVEHLENESNRHLRLQITRALNWIGSEKAVPALEAALEDEYPHVRKQAAVALKRITGETYKYDREGLPDPNERRKSLIERLEERMRKRSEELGE